MFLAVAVREAYQKTEPGANAAGDASVNADFGAGDALEQHAHGWPRPMRGQRAAAADPAAAGSRPVSDLTVSRSPSSNDTTGV